MRPKRERKVYYAFYDNECETSAYPVIRIAGKFLQDLGFRIGETIAVEYGNDRITITKEQKNEQKN